MTNFFLQHLYDEVKDRYGLTDEELDHVLKLTSKHNTSDVKHALEQLRRRAKPAQVKDLVDTMPNRSMKMEPLEVQPISPLAIPVSNPTMQSLAGPVYSIPLSKKEVAAAENLRKQYQSLLLHVDDFSDFMDVFFSSIDLIEDNTNLESLQPLLRKYQRKLKAKFNDFIKEFGEVLNGSLDMFSDRKFDNIRDLLIENVKSVRDSLIELLKLFKDIEEKSFVKSAKQLNTAIKNDIEQIKLIIKKQLFQHIDRDYLGKIRLS